MACWLLKTEPEQYAWSDLLREGTTEWTGVRNRAGEVWDGASATMKGAVTRDEFVRQINIDRNRLGAPTKRDQPVVSRSQFRAGEAVPEGIYINVASPTTFASQPQAVRELVSFRLDEDRTWRVSGYSLR